MPAQRPNASASAASRRRHVRLAMFGLVTALLLAGCGTSQSVLAPAGPRAAHTATLWWILFGVAVVIYVLVVGYLIIALWLARRAREPRQEGDGRALRFVLIAGVLLPAIVLLAVYVLGLRTMDVLAKPDKPPVAHIEVIGHQWWWEFRYLQGQDVSQEFTTANELHVPAGQPVQISVTSADVIHSFWVPELTGKIDVFPGLTNTIWLQADTVGSYRGQCAEFCGVQHAHMAFFVVADPPDQFASWLAEQAKPAPEPSTALERQGQQVFLSLACVACHTIRGTDAAGTLGPDLTHLASRDWIAAATLRNNPGTLGGWILNSQTIKPGNLMPTFALSPEDLNALLAYLGTLR